MDPDNLSSQDDELSFNDRLLEPLLPLSMAPQLTLGQQSLGHRTRSRLALILDEEVLQAQGQPGYCS